MTVLSKERYSEIVPKNKLLRLFFRLLRRFFGEEGKVSNWTRGWACVWMAIVLIGEHKGETYTHELRTLCVEWEHNKFAERKSK